MRKVIILIISLILMQGFLTAAENKEETETKKITLENGVSVITREIHNNIVSLQIWFKTGERNEDEKNNGISHFIEHLVFKGTKKRGVNALSEEIESVGGRLNGATSKDYTVYHVTLAKDFFDLALDGLMDSVLNPVFDKDELEKERKVVVEEILRQQDNPNACLSNLLNGISYENHPYKMPVIGKREIIESMDRETVRSYYNKFYLPET